MEFLDNLRIKYALGLESCRESPLVSTLLGPWGSETITQGPFFEFNSLNGQVRIE